MARAGCRTNGLQKLDGDDIEKSIEVLDKVLSEFEDPDSLPHIPIHIEPESPSQGNQSEDDGYMSMNGRRAKIPPDFHQPLSNESLASPPSSSSGAQMVLEPILVNHPLDEKILNENESVNVVSNVKISTEMSPPSSEIAQEIISNLLPKISPSTTQNNLVDSSIIENTDRINNAKNNLQNQQLDNKTITNGLTSVDYSDKTQLKSLDCASPHRIAGSVTIDGKIVKDSRDSFLIIHKLQQNIIDAANPTEPAQQTTLPKTRPSNVIPSRYASLPCSGQARGAYGSHLDRFGRGIGGGSFDGGGGVGINDRNILGIGISAVHDAVLRGGVAKLPEPIVNEHPVTIYPGRASPPGRRVPPRTLPGSIEKHREVCRNTDPNGIVTPNSNYDYPEGYDDANIGKHFNQFSILNENDSKIMSSLQRIAITKSPSSPLVSVHQHIILQNSVSSNQLIDNKNLLNSLQIPPNKPQRKHLADANGGGGGGGGGGGDFGDGIGIGVNLMNCNNNINNNNNNHNYNNKKNKRLSANTSDSSSEEFSDDSLEGQSLPQPPGPPIVPPPPSLSAPVTPSKRGSIAWEINLDDNLPSSVTPSSQLSGQLQYHNHHHHHHQQHQHQNTKNQHQFINRNGKNTNDNKHKNGKNASSSTGGNGGGKEKLNKVETSASAKIISRRRGRSQTGGSQSSLASTPGNSGGSMSNQNSPQHHNHQLYFNAKLKNRSSSMEWPEPNTTTITDSAPVCSTEDEAASIYSDSDDVIPSYPINMIGKGTYVIRKGRKERNRLSDIHTSMSSSINSRLSNEGSLLSGMTVSQSLLVPNSRHSIDLGSTATTLHSPTSSGSCLPAMLSPRSRLSLDLGSPNHIASDHPPVSLHTILSESGSNTTSSSQLQQQTQQHITTNSTSSRYANEFNKYNSYDTTTTGMHQHHHHHETNGNGGSCGNLGGIGNGAGIGTCGGNNGNLNNNNNLSNSTGNMNGSLPRSAPQNDTISTPRRELAPPIEEDEEQDSESQSRGAPLRQIENNISALLRGDIAVARVGDIPAHARRPLGFRPGVHKSESAKEMLLSQTAFGPLPPSPLTSSPEPEIEVDAFPPLPPSPQENIADDEDEVDESDMVRGLHGIRLSSRTRLKSTSNDHAAPAIPPHRSSIGGGIGIIGGGHHQQPQPSINTLKTRSMDAGYTKKYSTNSSHVPGTLPGEMPSSNASRRRLQSGAFPKRAAQSPREERRLQTSCSLPETPIFARGCDIPRTPHRRAPETPCAVGINCGGSRTAPRTNTTASLGSSIVGIGNTFGGGRRPLAGAEMLRLAGGPARGWYPKQRTMRPASTEHLDRLHRSQGSMRAWDTAIGVGGGCGGMSPGGMMTGGGGIGGQSGGGCIGRKPLTLPPNLTPKFFNKSPREALRRVTSLLIKKGNSKDKETKQRDKEAFTSSSTVHRSPGSAGDMPINQIYINNGNATSSSTASTTNQTSNHQHKKKGFFKNFWKKSKHYSLDQQ